MRGHQNGRSAAEQSGEAGLDRAYGSQPVVSAARLAPPWRPKTVLTGLELCKKRIAKNLSSVTPSARAKNAMPFKRLLSS